MWVTGPGKAILEVYAVKADTNDLLKVASGTERCAVLLPALKITTQAIVSP